MQPFKHRSDVVGLRTSDSGLWTLTVEPHHHQTQGMTRHSSSGHDVGSEFRVGVRVVMLRALQAWFRACLCSRSASSNQPGRYARTPATWAQLVRAGGCNISASHWRQEGKEGDDK